MTEIGSPLEHVVLLSEQGTPIGSFLKDSVHTRNTPLHLGFSLFLLNGKGEILLQKRSANKKTWPLFWSGSCCGHPAPGEDVAEAIMRRSWFELGLHPVKIKVVLPNYRYSCSYNGIAEKEICPVAVGIVDSTPNPNPGEVSSVDWVHWRDIGCIHLKMQPLTPWCREQLQLLASSDEAKTWLLNQGVPIVR